jgi:large repetitive protein
MRLIPPVAVFLVVSTAAIAQAPKPEPLAEGTSAIRGTVTDALTKAPLAGCEVRAGMVSARRTSVVTTGADGSYEFSGISDGMYSLGIQCPSHLAACLRPSDAVGPSPCASFPLLRDQQRSGLDFRLTPGAVARGRVVDGSGKPVPKATVRLGGPFIDRPVFPMQGVTTKADGTFELRNVPDGAWPFEVDVPQLPGAPRPPIIYHPGVISRDDAGLIELVAGRVTANITITVPRILDSTLTVRVPPPDETLTSVVVSITRPSPLMTQRLALDADGQAVVRGLVAGRYLVTAMALQGQQRWVDHQAVDFVEDSIEVSLHLQPAGHIRGRIVTDRGGLPPLSDATVGAAWVDEDVVLNPLTPDESAVAIDGTFSIDGLFGRRRLQLIRFDSDWRIQSILYGRIDVTESGVEVVPNSAADVTIVVGKR